MFAAQYIWPRSYCDALSHPAMQDEIFIFRQFMAVSLASIADRAHLNSLASPGYSSSLVEAAKQI
jgi:hypothetical protein